MLNVCFIFFQRPLKIQTAKTAKTITKQHGQTLRHKIVRRRQVENRGVGKMQSNPPKRPAGKREALSAYHSRRFCFVCVGCGCRFCFVFVSCFLLYSSTTYAVRPTFSVMHSGGDRSDPQVPARDGLAQAGPSSPPETKIKTTKSWKVGTEKRAHSFKWPVGVLLELGPSWYRAIEQLKTHKR